MGKIVTKFGGSSLADAKQFQKVKSILDMDTRRCYVVPSAPGRRFDGDDKVTDLLYKAHREQQNGQDFSATFSRIRERYCGIAKELELEIDINEYLDEVYRDIAAGATGDYCASRGEYLNGLLLADYLGFTFLDPKDFIFFNKDGTFNSERTNDALTALLKYTRKAVIPGFYGSMEEEIHTFSRGGSDISGAIVARAAKAEMYENWTDVSGFYACDPRIVNSPKWIPELTYQELRELSYMGANVLHSESIFPVRSAGIPIRICNTFSPKDKGTYIVKNSTRDMRDYVVTGVAGKKGFTSITLEKSLMNSEVGFVEKVLSVIGRRKISFEHLPSGIDTMSLVIDNEYLKDNALEDLMAEMKAVAQPDKIYAHENIALVATVGHGMAKNVGTSARLFKALSQAGINVNMIDQGSSELNIIVGVENEDCADCIRAIYEEFLGGDENEVF